MKNGTVMSHNGKARWATINALQAYNNRKLTKKDWMRQLKMANRNTKLRVAKETQEGLERSFALTDLERNVIKKKMMTSDEAYRRNKVTRKMGLFWVLCG